MREYKIYAEMDGSESLNFKKFIKEIEERINNDSELMERTRKINRDFAEKMKEMLQNDDNAEYIGAMTLRVIWEQPRYSYIKKLNYNGKEYEAEIDHLSRRFNLQEF